MRTSLFFAFVLLAGVSYSQQFFPGDMGYTRSFTGAAAFAPANSINTPKKWSLQKYTSLSAGLTMWKGGSASYISAPIGLQLTRRINNNLFAFAGLSVAPSAVSFRQAFTTLDFTQSGLRGMNSSYGFGMYSRAELGLGYVNDAHTFEIRGSIGIQRNDYPFQPVYRSVGTNKTGILP